MQIFNSFNELAVASMSPTHVSGMSTFNATQGTEQELIDIVKKYLMFGCKQSTAQYNAMKKAILDSGKTWSDDVFDKVAQKYREYEVGFAGIMTALDNRDNVPD